MLSSDGSFSEALGTGELDGSLKDFTGFESFCVLILTSLIRVLFFVFSLVVFVFSFLMLTIAYFWGVEWVCLSAIAGPFVVVLNLTQVGSTFE